MPTTRANKLIFATLIALILSGILRSAIATRLHSFDVDEAYHITAGVSYIRLGDYRLNPEHPPLVKLWVRAFLPRSFRTPQLRPMAVSFFRSLLSQVKHPNAPLQLWVYNLPFAIWVMR